MPRNFDSDPADNSPSIPAHSCAIVMSQVVELGGAERACLALSRWLFKQGIHNHFVTYSDSVGLVAASEHPLTVVQLQPKMNPTSKILALRSYFHGRPSAPRPLMSGYQPALHATIAGLRGFHCLMHDTPSLFSEMLTGVSARQRLQRLFSDQITGFGLRSGGETIVTSAYLCEESRRVFHVNARIARMGGFSSLNGFRPRPFSNALRLFSVSRVEANKRIDWMLRALAQLEHGAEALSGKIDWKLDVAGRGSQLELMRALAAELRLSDRVQFHGFVSDAALAKLFDEADLFLMPAVQGYGIPAIESLQRGIPVLLHRDSGVSDILSETPWATVFEGDESSMLPALSLAIRRVREGHQLNAPLPEMPSEDSWAEHVAGLCGWF